MANGISNQYTNVILNIGFIAALILSGATLTLSAIYLNGFMSTTNDSLQTLFLSSQESQIDAESLRLAIAARMSMARLSLLSCGIFVGMAFGFLGFALFLLGVKGEMDVDAKSEGYQVKIARISPGVFVLLCSIILIGICATNSRQAQFSWERTYSSPSSNGGETPSNRTTSTTENQDNPDYSEALDQELNTEEKQK